MAYDEKATVSIDGEGAVMKCAKGLAADACGYVKGAKVCGKCGAMAVEMKMVPAVDMEEGDSEMMDDEEKMYGMEMMPKKKKRMGAMPNSAEMDDEESEMETEMEDGMEDSEEEMEDEESEKQNIMMDKFKKRKSSKMSEEDDEEMMEDEEEDEHRYG